MQYTGASNTSERLALVAMRRLLIVRTFLELLFSTSTRLVFTFAKHNAT
jgi:hypothetical protein